MRELGLKDVWMLKDWCSQTVVLGKTLRIPWTARRAIQSILKKINQNIHRRDWCLSWSTSTQWREFEQAPRDGEGQGSLVWCNPRGHKFGHDCETTTTEYSKLVKILSEHITQRKMFSLIIILEYMVRNFFAHCLHNYVLYHCCSVAKSWATLWDPMDGSMPGFLSFTISWICHRFMSIVFVMLSNHLICCILLFAFNISQHQDLF